MSPKSKQIVKFYIIFLFANLIHLSYGTNQYGNISNLHNLNRSNETPIKVSNGTTTQNLQEIKGVKEYGKVQILKKTPGDPRIVGGYKCPHENYTYFVRVGRKKFYENNPKWLCGGSVISASYILSAAHCFHTTRSYDYYIKTWNDKVYKGRKFYSHAEYSPILFNQDVAVLSLKTPIEDTTVQFVELPWILVGRSESILDFCQEALVMGYGLTEPDGRDPSPYLKCAISPLVSNERCADSYNLKVITDGVVCALNPTLPESVCSGDSGGPMLCNGIQIGIVSWGDECADLDMPTVFTKVDMFMDFILDVISERGGIGHRASRASSFDLSSKTVYIINVFVIIYLNL